MNMQAALIGMTSIMVVTFTVIGLTYCYAERLGAWYDRRSKKRG